MRMSITEASYQHTHMRERDCLATDYGLTRCYHARWVQLCLAALLGPGKECNSAGELGLHF